MNDRRMQAPSLALLRMLMVAAAIASCSDQSVVSSNDGATDAPSASDAVVMDAPRRGCGLVTCESAGATCGPIGDGCGGVIRCGDCTAPQTCGGGGRLSQCGGTSGCVPRTCAALGVSCGPAGDGCGGQLDCGSCPDGQSCGGGGRPGACGSGGATDAAVACVRRTCESAGATCGAVSDGCGGLLMCGTCPAGQSCGGGGMANRCGGSACVPRTCASAGATCGPVADGCGGLLMCGTCAAGQSCGGGGRASVCGVAGSSSACVPRTCGSAAANCGPVSDGCGGLLMCGTCPAGQTCGGGGRPSICGTGGTSDAGSACVPRTCGSASANCGPVADGCGGLLMCGTCPAGTTCGGGGRASVCGSGGAADAGRACVPRTCGSASANCGPVADGCGGLLMCGTCPAGTTCGGGGVASVCGAPRCVPRTCTQARANCGPVADGCGALLDCGLCAPGTTCGGGGTPSVCGAPGGSTACTGLCLRRAMCAGGATTTISGTVVTPAMVSPDPLYNAVVYIPNTAVAPFTPGVSCDRCGAATSGSPVVSAVTGPDGRFVLRDVPVGANIPLVIQLGRWRRQVTISNVASCVDNALPTTLTRLPRSRAEGDIPLMAMVTGNVDALECVLRKIGIADSEFTTPAGGGRVQLYVANGANAGRNTPAASDLYNTPATLSRYDMVLFACEGAHIEKPPAAQRNLVEYANAGGRVFTTHFSYTWLYNVAPFSSVATWRTRQTNPGNPLTGIIDTSFPRGQAFAQWLTLVGAATGLNRISINDPRHDVDAVVAPTARWIYSSTPATVQHLTFNTPVAAAPETQCGRVLFSDFHVSNGRTSGQTFPSECSGTTLTAQEKVLEFMLFDLASCVTPDLPRPTSCVPRTCLAAGATCGPVGDGCGGTLDCGACPVGTTCGGGGTPSVCGAMTCRPRTCTEQGLSCGPAGDGCGGVLNCGACAAGMTCGGGGTPGVCGTPACRPVTCSAQGLSCGPAGDGCGATLNCGTCATGTCGGGGHPGVCGSPSCTPTTCVAQGLRCGPAGDGCGGTIDCGACPAGSTCGGGGTPGVCGSAMCRPRTCMDQGLSCGPAGDGCGGVLDCGTCASPLSCGGGGTPGVCGASTCAAQTCASQNLHCGPAGDGCGGTLDCGACPAGMTCGGGGTPGVCGSGSCRARTCAEQNIHCGPAGDGCGNLIQCGNCPSPSTCGGAGMPGICGRGPCSPRTCAALNAECGPIADGCGGLLDCGPCPAGQACGGGGVANRCGAPG